MLNRHPRRKNLLVSYDRPGLAAPTGSKPVGDTSIGAGSCWNPSDLRPWCFPAPAKWKAR